MAIIVEYLVWGDKGAHSQQCKLCLSLTFETRGWYMGAKKDLKTLLIRFLLVVVYCLLGAAIFYAIEHKDEDEDKIKHRKDQLFNTTKTKIMRRFGINETEFDILAENIVQAKSHTPLQWTFTRGIDLCWQTITTIGRSTLETYVANTNDIIGM